jgi:hypothetical protein
MFWFTATLAVWTHPNYTTGNIDVHAILLPVAGCAAQARVSLTELLWLFINAAVRGPGEYQLWIATILLIGGVGLVATWFWSPFG